MKYYEEKLQQVREAIRKYPKLMNVYIVEEGQTNWDLHCNDEQLAKFAKPFTKSLPAMKKFQKNIMKQWKAYIRKKKLPFDEATSGIYGYELEDLAKAAITEQLNYMFGGEENLKKYNVQHKVKMAVGSYDELDRITSYVVSIEIEFESPNIPRAKAFIYGAFDIVLVYEDELERNPFILDELCE